MFKKKVLAVLLSMVMAMTMLVALPTAAHAATAAIDIGSLGGADAISTGTDADWRYVDSEKTLYLEEDGEYTLSGTNTDLRVRVIDLADGAIITLSGVDIKTPTTNSSPTLHVFASCTITLDGTNLLDNANNDGIVLDSGVECTINGSGSLSITVDCPTAVAVAGILFQGYSTPILRISDTATVSAVSLSSVKGCGMESYPNASLYVNAEATLNAKGYWGIGAGSYGNFNLNVIGALNAEATAGGVLLEGVTPSGFSLYGSGTITLKGASGAPVFDPSVTTINMDDNITLVVNSSDTGPRTVNFTKSSAVNTHMWKLTHATLVTPSVATDAVVNISIPVGASTITRAAPVCEIGSTQYFTLAAALADVPTSGATQTVIKLLTNITENDNVWILDKKITFDLNGYNLIIAAVLYVAGTSVVDYTGTGEFKIVRNFTDSTGTTGYAGIVIGAGVTEGANSTVVLTGIEMEDNGTGNNRTLDGIAIGSGCTVTVNGDIKITSNGGTQSYAAGIRFNSYGGTGGGAVTVNGDIISDWYGVIDIDSTDASPATVTVNGIIEAGKDGVLADGINATNTTVNGNIEAGRNGVVAAYGTVTVTGDITAVWDAVFANLAAKVTIEGNIDAGWDGLIAESYASITLTGDITAFGCAVGAYFNGSEITVEGNIEAYEGVKVVGTGITVTVVGDILAYNFGVYVNGGDGGLSEDIEITVTGNITVEIIGDGSSWSWGAGVVARDSDGLIITVNGDIDAGSVGVVVEFSEKAEILVNGSIVAGDTGVYTDIVEKTAISVAKNITAGFLGVDVWDDVLVFVGGNILVTEVGTDDYPNCGVFVGYGARVIVDGTITAPNYIAFPDPNSSGGSPGFYYLGINDNTKPTTLDGYLQYDDEGKYDILASYVWVKAQTTPGTGDSSALWLLLGALMVAALGCGLVFAHRHREQQEV